VTKSGPYPDPEDYEKYLRIDPELAQQMKDMVRLEQEHIHEINHKNVDNEYKLRKRGQVFALVIFILSIALAALALYFSQPWVAGLFSALGIGGIISQFLKKD